jgi:hypothetical protein
LTHASFFMIMGEPRNRAGTSATDGSALGRLGDE